MAKMTLDASKLDFKVTGNGNPTTTLTNDNQVVEIPTDKLIIDRNQCFKIHDDTIDFLAECIISEGQVSPCIVIPSSDGKYKIVDGRHRLLAIEQANIPFVKCIIRSDLATDEKAYKKVQITTNLARNNDYLPSELAYGYKELQELGYTRAKMAEETSNDKKSIYRYLRLTYLIKPLLDGIDNGSIPLIAGVDLSYLSEQNQKQLFQYILNNISTPITIQIAKRIKEVGKEKPLSSEIIDEICNTNEKSEEPTGTVFDDSSDFSERTENRPVDNLSTDKSEKQIKEKRTNNKDVSDKIFKITKQNRFDINPHIIAAIATAAIKITNIDNYIVCSIFNPESVVRYITENYSFSKMTSKIENSSPFYENATFIFNWAYIITNNSLMVHIRINDNEEFLIELSVLEEIIREYIQQNYSKDDFISIINAHKL